jgi:hypothetical protein
LDKGHGQRSDGGPPALIKQTNHPHISGSGMLNHYNQTRVKKYLRSVTVINGIRTVSYSFLNSADLIIRPRHLGVPWHGFIPNVLYAIKSPTLITSAWRAFMPLHECTTLSPTYYQNANYHRSGGLIQAARPGILFLGPMFSASVTRCRLPCKYVQIDHQISSVCVWSDSFLQ